jgi:hypothetical protein
MAGEEIIAHVRRLGLPESGVEYIRPALDGPSRFVGRNGFLAVSTRFASQKLGEVIQSESHTSELPFVHKQELDHDVLAVLDQPPSLPVETIDRRGRRHPHQKTPDYLVIRKDSVVLYECKQRAELNTLIETPTSPRF